MREAYYNLTLQQVVLDYIENNGLEVDLTDTQIEKVCNGLLYMLQESKVIDDVIDCLNS